MANLKAIHSLGSSLIRHLKLAFESRSDDHPSCDFQLFSGGNLAKLQDSELNNTVSLFLYRITYNEHLRNCVLPDQRFDENPSLSLDLHYLLTIWSESASDEQVIAAWVMRELHTHPLIDVSMLSKEAEWRPDEMVQVIPAELSTEDMMRIWDSISPSYRLSVSYVARAVRIDLDRTDDGPRVVATRYNHGVLEDPQ